jgi:hypothetical protein
MSTTEQAIAVRIPRVPTKWTYWLSGKMVSCMSLGPSIELGFLSC